MVKVAIDLGRMTFLHSGFLKAIIFRGLRALKYGRLVCDKPNIFA